MFASFKLLIDWRLIMLWFCSRGCCVSNLNCSGTFVKSAVHVSAADPREMWLIDTTTRRLWPKLQMTGKPEPLKEQLEFIVFCVETAYEILFVLSVLAPVHSSYSDLQPETVQKLSRNRSTAASGYPECRWVNGGKERRLDEGTNKWTDEQRKSTNKMKQQILLLSTWPS